MDHIFILECLYNNNYELLSVYDEEFSSDKAISMYMKLERKGYIVKDPEFVKAYIISVDGKELFEKLVSMSKYKYSHTTIKKTKEDLFNEWWNLYPLHSKWKYGNQDFFHMRGLRVDKVKCRKKYSEIINSGVVTHQQLIDCLKYEIKSRKLESIRTSDNKLAFMKGSLAYLNQEAWIPYLSLVEAEPEFLIDNKIDDDNSSTELI